MDDEQWIRSLDRIDDPVEALKCIVENEHFLGYDSYYADLREAMLRMARRIVEARSGLTNDKVVATT